MYSNAVSLLVHRFGNSVGLSGSPRKSKPTTLISPSKPGYFASGIKPIKHVTMAHGIGFM